MDHAHFTNLKDPAAFVGKLVATTAQTPGKRQGHPEVPLLTLRA